MGQYSFGKPRRIAALVAGAIDNMQLTATPSVAFRVPEVSAAARAATHVEMTYREDRRYQRVRRVADCAVALILLVVALPVLLAAAAAIALEDRGPVFFTQMRVGRFGKLFLIYKLRTMSTPDCVDALSPTSTHDPRITRVGQWLRKTSIDELPQLWNVLRGEMALVGPRPEMPFVVDRYEPWQHLRHLATPGITGLWQTTCRSSLPLHRPEATLLDLEYIRASSQATDIRILFQTVRAVVGAEGAC